MRLLPLALAASLFTGSALAEQPKLFKSWTYGSPASAYSETEGFYDCSAEVGYAARCIEEVDFLGHSFGAILSFNNQQLESVVLATDFSQDIYVKSVGALSKTFSMALMRGSNDQLDIIELARARGGKEAFMARLNNYETLNLQQGQLTYFYLEQPATALMTRRNAVDATVNAPADVRSAELSVTDNDGEPLLLINFSLPRLTLQNLKQALQKAPAEDF